MADTAIWNLPATTFSLTMRIAVDPALPGITSQLSGQDFVDGLNSALELDSTAQVTGLDAALNARLEKAQNLADVADVPTARTNLGLGSLALQDANSVAITGGTINGVNITTSAIDSTPVGNTNPANGTFTNLTAQQFFLRDNGGAGPNDLILNAPEAFTANRILNIQIEDAPRTLTLSGAVSETILYGNKVWGPQNVVYVAKSGAEYESIQDAVDDLSPTSVDRYTIVVGPGDYNEQVVSKRYISMYFLPNARLTPVLPDGGSALKVAPDGTYTNITIECPSTATAQNGIEWGATGGGETFSNCIIENPSVILETTSGAALVSNYYTATTDSVTIKDGYGELKGTGSLLTAMVRSGVADNVSRFDNMQLVNNALLASVEPYNSFANVGPTTFIDNTGFVNLSSTATVTNFLDIDDGLLINQIPVQSPNFLRTRQTAAGSVVIGLDGLLGVVSLAAPITLTIPTAAAAIEGYTYTIKDEVGNAATNAITLIGEGSEMFDGDTSLVISADYGCARIYSDGSNWFTE